MEHFPTPTNGVTEPTQPLRKPFAPADYSGPLDSYMFLTSYERSPHRELLKEASIHGQAIKLTVPPFLPPTERAQNPLNQSENCINGNVIAVVGLPGATDHRNRWKRREFALVDYGPEAETKPILTHLIPTISGRFVGPETTVGYRYGIAPYNYNGQSFQAAYAPLRPDEPITIGSGYSGDSDSDYARTILDLAEGDTAGLRNVSAEQLIIVMAGGEITLQDTSQYGTDIAYLGEGSIY